ncbi:hypothetical protein LTR85_006518 [Meristemomyces frigidus]|nr:hypothetical protein LTR85_006518 [Meristemomyces frigidus]
MHKAPCGLPLCPWKDRDWKKEKKVKGSSATGAEAEATRPGRGAKGRKRELGNEEDQARPAKRTKIHQPKHPLNTDETRNQRVRPIVRHRGDPTPTAKSRQKTSYEDEAPASSPATPSANEKPAEDDRETCFFWYHGSCARANDIRHNYTCRLRHALTEPPTMVQPPPRYTHARPCGLEWCPGDARTNGASEGRTRKDGVTDRTGRPRTGKKAARKKVSVLTRGTVVEDAIDGEEDCASEADSEVPSCGQPEVEVGTGEECVLRGFPESLI